MENINDVEKIKNEVIDFFDFVYKCRGRVIQSTISFELSLNLLIVQHFTNDVDKSSELLNILNTQSSSFQSKIQMILYLIEKKNQTTTKEIKKLKSTLEFLIRHRNIFAHWVIGTNENHLKLFKERKCIELYQFKLTLSNGKYIIGDNETYDEVRINNIIKLMNKIENLIVLYLK